MSPRATATRIVQLASTGHRYAHAKSAPKPASMSSTTIISEQPMPKMETITTTTGKQTRDRPFTHPVKVMRINTCAPLYNEWHSTGFRNKLPLRGVDFDVVYGDTMPKAASDKPVVLALHGTPGSYLHFSQMADFMSDKGTRFVVPNFPAFGVTKDLSDGAFRHSPSEKSHFIVDFLQALGISKVDMVVAHSSSIYTALFLSAYTDVIKSLALLNPAGHEPIRAIRPLWVILLACKLYRQRLIRPVVVPIINLINSVSPVAKWHNGVHEVMMAAETMTNEREFTVDRMTELAFKKIPLFMAFAERDPLVERRLFYKMVDILGIPKEAIYKYSEDGELESEGYRTYEDRYAHVMSFEKKSHFCMHSYPDLVHKALSDLLNLTKNPQQSANS